MLRPFNGVRIDSALRRRAPPGRRRRMRHAAAAARCPSDEVARTALDSALKAWRDGKKPGDLAGTEPRVAILDTAWAHGDRLESYEILGEEPGVAEKRFAVRLSMAKPAGCRK